MSSPGPTKRPAEDTPADRPANATVALPNPKRSKAPTATAEEAEPSDVTDWRRPALLPFDSDKTFIAIQQLEADYYVTEKTPALPAVDRAKAVSSDGVGELPAAPALSDVQLQAIATANEQRRAVIRVFGVTDAGNSVAFNVHNFLPYFYIPAWRNVTAKSLQDFKDALNNRLLAETRDREKAGITTACLGVEVIRKKSIWGYHDTTSDFIRVIVAVPTMVATAARVLGASFTFGDNCQSFTTYESNVSADRTFVLRFMIDVSTAGGAWLEAPGGAYSVRGREADKLTTCQLEIDLDARHVVAHESAGRWLKMAPLRVFSFDIECAGRRGHFPTPDQDSVIQIASCVALSENLNKPLHKAVHTLNTCAGIAGADVVPNATEEGLLRTWAEHFRTADPDIVTGYNIVNFDTPYLIDRAKVLKVNDFAQFTRVKGLESVVRDTTFSSGAHGKQENKQTNMDGRVQFDVLVAVRREYKLRSFSLNAVSAEFLKQQKEDVHFSIITDLQNGTDETRKRLAEYCLKDAILPLRLMQKLMFLINYVEMARVTGVPINYLLVRGESIKVISQLLRKARQHDLVIPVVKKQNNGDDYEGATVLAPMTGYYADPIATLDFASLYPSIMMAHNLCYTTMISAADAAKLGDEKCHKTPNGDWFVNETMRRGVLPEILEELLTARKAAKKAMGAAEDPFTKAVLNGRQLALKISANSVYGFTGAQVGQLPCLAISSSVTSYGRTMLELTRQSVQEHYCKANGYEHDAVVIYGDTDSVMVKFGTSDIKEAMRLGLEAATLVSKKFKHPIRLEFEKVYWPYLLLARKRYVGLYWTRPDKWDKIDAKGVESVRRDNCGLVKKLFQECIDTILVKRSPELAVAHVKATISQLLLNKIDLSLLVISKSLGKGASSGDYDAKQAHVELAERMRKRDPASAPAVGDRVPFVIIKAPKGAPNYEKSEDPIWVLENDLPIDTDYYIENQLKGPLVRLFEPILGPSATDELFRGEHTLHIKVTSGSATSGSIMQFAKKTETCVRCRTALPTGRRALCIKCEPRRAEVLVQKVHDNREHEAVFSKLWSQCQRCQGSTHQEVLCSSRDCPIFYRRKKVQLDLAETTGVIERLSLPAPPTQ